jgi:hypothetical protein
MEIREKMSILCRRNLLAFAACFSLFFLLGAVFLTPIAQNSLQKAAEKTAADYGFDGITAIPFKGLTAAPLGSVADADEADRLEAVLRHHVRTSKTPRPNSPNPVFSVDMKGLTLADPAPPTPSDS